VNQDFSKRKLMVIKWGKRNVKMQNDDIPVIIITISLPKYSKIPSHHTIQHKINRKSMLKK
jgi:hypothetical protein